MMSTSGLTDFQADLDNAIKETGGYHSIVRTNYGRNIWRIMKEFNVLPTDPTFKELSNEQLDFLVASIEQDNREMKLASSGKEEDSYVNDSEFDYYNEDMEYGGKRNDEDAIKQFIENATRKDKVAQEQTKAYDPEEQRQFYQKQIQSGEPEKPQHDFYPEDDEYDTI